MPFCPVMSIPWRVKKGHCQWNLYIFLLFGRHNRLLCTQGIYEQHGWQMFLIALLLMVVCAVFFLLFLRRAVRKLHGQSAATPAH